VVKDMINSRFAVAIHILSLVAAGPREQVTSEFIAGSVNTNPVVIRRISSLLRKAGLIQSNAGTSGSILTKEPHDISLLDVYLAVQNKDDLFSIHENTNPNCTVGKNIQSTLEESFHRAQVAMENELAKQSLDDIIKHLFV
jgi:DNA-binding IscR family transcriptional regulator